MESLHYTSLIGVAAAMALAAAIPAFFPRLLVPGVVLELAFGVVLGPQVMHVLVGGPIAHLLYVLGLSMLFLIAGYEVNPSILRGHPIKDALLGWVMSAVIAIAVAAALTLTGAARDPVVTALALSTTTLGALMPILRDGGLLYPPYGPYVLAAGAVGEVAPVIVLSLVLARGADSILEVVLLASFGVAAGALVYAIHRAHLDGFSEIVKRSLSTSGQFPVRLAVCVLILLVALTSQLNVDLVLGAFVAGMIMRAAIPAEHHEQVAIRLDGLGFAFLIPTFFIIAGSQLDVYALVHDWRALALVPVYAVAMLVVRGVPALVLYRKDLHKLQQFGLAFHSGTQLSLVVAITALAARHGMISGGQAAAMVGAGIITLLVYPAIASALLKKKYPATATSEIGG